MIIFRSYYTVLSIDIINKVVTAYLLEDGTMNVVSITQTSTTGLANSWSGSTNAALQFLFTQNGNQLYCCQLVKTGFITGGLLFTDVPDALKGP